MSSGNMDSVLLFQILNVAEEHFQGSVILRSSISIAIDCTLCSQWTYHLFSVLYKSTVEEFHEDASIDHILAW